MKKNYFLILLLTFMTIFSYGQTTVFTESFETGNAAIASETCNDNGGDFFTRTDGSDISSSYVVTGKDGDYFFAAQDTDGSPCSMTTQTLLFNDINIASFSNLTLALLLAEDQPSDGKFDWDGGDLFYIEVDYDNSGSFTKVLQFATTATTGFNVSAPMQDTDFDGIGDGPALTEAFTEFTSGIGTGTLIDIRLVFENLGAGDEDIALDNIRLIDGFVANTQPALSVSGITDNQVFNPETTEVSVNVSVSNFNLSADNGSGLSDSSGDGYIKTTFEVAGGTTEVSNFFSTTLPNIQVAAGESYTLTMELVDNAGASLSPEVKATAMFSVASFTDVADIAALRAGTEGDFYKITGEVVVTYTTSNRNQKYIQDASGAILIDDTADVLAPGNYVVGDGSTNLNGRLSSFSGVLQFVPVSNSATKSSTGNTVTPTSVTLSELNSNLDNYESEMIIISDVTFTDGDGTAVFTASTNYDLSQGTDMLVFRTNFGDADFIGDVIPSSPVNITGIASEFNGTAQIFGTSAANITLDVARNAILGFATYPNPITNHQFTVTTGNNSKKEIAIYNLLGKQVLSTSFNGTKATIDVANITAGIYILKVTENDKTATRKLVIK